MKIQFEGAAQTVTGSHTVLTLNNTTFAIDCGLYQGPKTQRLMNWNEPQHIHQVKSILLTHAHIDHSGLLPRWARWGWKGKIYCTPSTADLLKIMLLDAARLQVEDARYANQTQHSNHDPALPLYTERDAEEALDLIQTLDFNRWQELTPDLKFQFIPAGHILGSAIIKIQYIQNLQTKTITFSGDLGGGHSDILNPPEPVSESHSLVLESTYGNRTVNSQGREDRLAEVIHKVFDRNGTLIIPAFAVGRTQDLLFSIYRLSQENKIPQIPIYLDSPMAKSVTQIYKKYFSEFKYQQKNIELSLTPPNFTEVESPDESMLLCMSEEPKIVISASGMLQGGRVLHHLKQKLPDKKNGVLFVGFQGQETKGRLLQEGLLDIRIHHQKIPVEAEIFTIEGYSAHADAQDILNWVKNFKQKPDRIFLNHGEYESQKALADLIKTEIGIEPQIPVLHQEYIV